MQHQPPRPRFTALAVEKTTSSPTLPSKSQVNKHIRSGSRSANHFYPAPESSEVYFVKTQRIFVAVEMAAKEPSAPLRGQDGDEEPLLAWQMAWFRRHYDSLVERISMSTEDIVDCLAEKGWVSDRMDVYQKINSQATIPNERARLLLGFIKRQSPACFWDFQDALAAGDASSDLAIAREDEQVFAGTFSVEELTAAYYSGWEEGRPSSVVKVNKKLKERYRGLKMPSLDLEAGRKPVSLDQIRVNICLLSADKLDALCGSPGQDEPFELDSLKEKTSSVINLEDLFPKRALNEAADLLMAAGIAGSGKSTAFTLKAAFEWAKVDCDEPFWELFSLFFTGSLTDPSWWKAKDLAEVFGLGRYGLTEVEQKELVAYMCDHSEEILLVADSLDEADVDKRSLLWQILCGKCQDLPKIHVIICSRPCEKTLWLSKHCLFNQRLEVVGFTEEKIGQFVAAFFTQSPQKAHDLQVQLASRPEVRSLMHTPLLATMICRLFQLEKALPSTQTGVYQLAILAMLQQTTEREMEEIPKSILDDLSPPDLQVAVENLCKLAYEGLAEKKVVFTKSELRAAGCLGTAVELGFLSSTPSVSIAGQGEDAYSFQHHTMLEFFAAVHTVRDRIRKAKESIADLISKLGVDGDYSRFWPFVSGLLSGEECKLLLSALAANVQDAWSGSRGRRKANQHFLLLLQCHVECVSQLPRDGSPSVAAMLKSLGLQLNKTHLSLSDAHAAAKVLQMYGARLTDVCFHNSSIDDGGNVDFLTGLQECTQLRKFDIGVLGKLIGAAGLRQVLERNKTSLEVLVLPVSDVDFPEIAPAIKACSDLVSITCGSAQLTNVSAPMVAEVLRLLPRLGNVGLQSEIDDDGFAQLETTLCNKANRLARLKLYQTKVSPALLSRTLASLTKLSLLTIVENPIGDDGFRQLACSLRQLSNLKQLHLCGLGLTWRSLADLEKILLSCPKMVRCHIFCDRRSFPPPGEDITKVPSLTTLRFVVEKAYSELRISYGYKITHSQQLQNVRKQALFLKYYG